MKTLKHYILGVFVLALLSPLVIAQEIDTKRMNLDINIMENILNELFKENSINTSGNFTFNLGSFGNSNDIKGSYLPDFGVIFWLNTSSRRAFIVRSKNSNDLAFSYDSNTNKNASNEINEETITARIKEFLKNYASVIGQLKPADKVMVIYSSKEKNLFPALRFQTATSDTTKQEQLPTISVSASFKDLQNYRLGKVSDAEFDKSLDISKSVEKEFLDLKVMSNIFETAFKNENFSAFQISGSVDYLNIDNYGALFSFAVRAPYLSPNDIKSISIDKNKGGIFIERKDTQESVSPKESFDTLKEEVQKYIVDYGRTISSVDKNGHILISISIQNNDGSLPSRVNFQIKKSVLDQLNKGSISREQAISKIKVSEY